MKILSSFLRKQLGSMLLPLLLFFVSLITFLLYDLPLEPILYGFSLCIVFWLIFIIISYLMFRKKYLSLLSAKDSIMLQLSTPPVSHDCIESLYHEMIQALAEKSKALEYDAEKNYRDLMDYYTIWVHQIKVPLSALKLLLQTYEIESKEIKGELFKIEQYVNMVLQYLRLDSLSSDLVLDRYSLNAIVKQAIRNYSTLFITKEISLELEEIQAEVLTDEKWLLFVLEQILSNALKYTQPKGKIFIYMKNDTTLVIRDTGIGISEENIRRVFERGFTGYNGRTDKSASGLGLFLSKTILNKLSHTIEIQSVPSHGTTVLIGLGSVPLSVE